MNEKITLRKKIEDTKADHLRRYGELNWKYTDEGLPYAIQDYHGSVGSVLDFTEDDWLACKENGWTMNEVLELVNKARADAGLAALELDPALCGAAQVRAKECVGTFSHTRPDGTKYKTAISEAGVDSNYTGENVATGHTSARQVVDAWLRSEGHRANILNEKFTKLGVGFSPNTGNRYRGYAWSQLFVK